MKKKGILVLVGVVALAAILLSPKILEKIMQEPIADYADMDWDMTLEEAKQMALNGGEKETEKGEIPGVQQFWTERTGYLDYPDLKMIISYSAGEDGTLESVIIVVGSKENEDILDVYGDMYAKFNAEYEPNEIANAVTEQMGSDDYPQDWWSADNADVSLATTGQGFILSYFEKLEY